MSTKTKQMKVKTNLPICYFDKKLASNFKTGRTFCHFFIFVLLIIFSDGAPLNFEKSQKLLFWKVAWLWQLLCDRFQCVHYSVLVSALSSCFSTKTGKICWQFLCLMNLGPISCSVIFAFSYNLIRS